MILDRFKAHFFALSTRFLSRYKLTVVLVSVLPWHFPRGTLMGDFFLKHNLFLYKFSKNTSDTLFYA